MTVFGGQESQSREWMACGTRVVDPGIHRTDSSWRLAKSTRGTGGSLGERPAEYMVAAVLGAQPDLKKALASRQVARTAQS